MRFFPGPAVKPARLRESSLPASALALVLWLATGWLVVWAHEPRIESIERLGTNAVTIHFSADAGRAYTVQYRDGFPGESNRWPGTNALSSGWSNLVTLPAFPFANHYVIPDTRTHPHRFYRLSVTP